MNYFDLPMGGCSSAAKHSDHLAAGDPVCENERSSRCPICIEHPGWTSPDPRFRSDSRDACIACFGSGVEREINAGRVVGWLQRASLQVESALEDEAEAEFTRGVYRVANRAQTLVHLVANW